MSPAFRAFVIMWLLMILIVLSKIISYRGPKIRKRFLIKKEKSDFFQKRKPTACATGSRQKNCMKRKFTSKILRDSLREISFLPALLAHEIGGAETHEHGNAATQRGRLVVVGALIL